MFLYYIAGGLLLFAFLLWIIKYIIREAIKEAFEEMGYYKRK